MMAGPTVGRSLSHPARRLPSVPDRLIDYDKDGITAKTIMRLEKNFMSNPNFTVDMMRKSSSAAAGFCACRSSDPDICVLVG